MFCSLGQYYVPIDNSTVYIHENEPEYIYLDLHITSGLPTNNPPYEPSDPFPTDGATGIGLNVDLSWTGGDPDGDPVTYDVYFEANDPTPDDLKSDDQTETTYDPGSMDKDTTYYWQIIAKDDHGASTDGPIWNFTTTDQDNRPPNKPTNPLPTDGATNQETSVTLSVDVSDPDGDTLDVYFYDGSDNLIGTANSVSSGNTASVTWSDRSTSTTYSWYAVANDSQLENKSDTWTFTTKSGGDPNPNPNPPSSDKYPKANAGGPYYGYVDEVIDFDGSGSTDDKSIESYSWDFGDGSTGTGVNPTHAYSAIGTYTVILTVTDNDNPGKTNTATTTATIEEPPIPNNPPEKPEFVTKTTKGTKNTLYEYSAITIDLDDHDISYTFGWADETNDTITDFFANGTVCDLVNHTWATYGIYHIWVEAIDDYENGNGTPSGKTFLKVLIDVHEVKDIGYLIDDNSNGTYDRFYSNETGEITDVELQEDGSYLINSDTDDSWDYVYELPPDLLTEYGEEKDEPVEDDMIWYLLGLGILLVLIILILVFLATKNKGKPKKPKK